MVTKVANFELDKLQFGRISPERLYYESCPKLSLFLRRIPQIMRNYAHFELFLIFWSHFLDFWTIFRVFRPTTISQKIFRLVGTYAKLTEKVEQVLFWT